MQDVNKAYDSIDKAYKEVVNIKDEIDNNIFEKVNKKELYDFTNIKAFLRYDNGSITETADGNSTDFVA